MSELRRAECDDCGRLCYEPGGRLTIEAARRTDGTQPIDDFLRDVFDTDKNSAADILIRFEEFARIGTLTVPLQLNSLGFGIHEIKTAKTRLAFYYQDRHPKIRAVRLTNGWSKRGQKAPPKHIRSAQRLRGEDEGQ